MTFDLSKNLPLPTGTVTAYAGSSAPTGWLLCDGSEKAVATYPALDALLGTTYGARTNGSGGAGSTHFRLPDLRGRVIAGKDNMGGTAASRLTNSGTGNPSIDGATLGASGGADRHTLTIAQLASHSHASGNHSFTVTNSAAAGYFYNGTNFDGSRQTTAATTANTGSDNAHPNAQPTLVLNHIIKF